MNLATVDGERIRFTPHPGQWRAWNAEERFVCVLAGTQGGKTVFGPHWLYREIQRCGPGDYLVVAPTFQLLEKKALPEFRRLLEEQLQLGRYQTVPSRKFVFTRQGELSTFGETDLDVSTTVWFGYAEDPESLESATVKAAWLDEAGQKKFRVGSWEAIRRRVAIHRGRILITTTPYDLGWIKQVIHDRWKAGDPDYRVIRFDSTENPAFPKEEFEAARRELPGWKFDLFYRGILSRPAGLIYDSFIDEFAPSGHKVNRFELPKNWPRYAGVDFGQVNTAAVLIAAEPATKNLYLYRTYRAGGQTSGEHARAIIRGEPMTPQAVGGSHQEEGWRDAFRAGGLPIAEPPIRDVEVGIDCVYGAFKRNELFVFSDLAEYLDELGSYSREVDERGEPTEKIEDKSRFHLMDATRYLLSRLRPLTAPIGRPVAGGTRPILAEYSARHLDVPAATPVQPSAGRAVGRKRGRFAAG